jgi:TetR/AcrR family transcriptional regulator, cholesterol catabolism regulator
MASAPAPSRPALRERYDRRQERVVEIAAELFAERGFAATSMADLSGATGLAAGGLYHYIGSKKQLLFRICDELMEPLLAEARAIVATDAPALDRLRALLRAWLEHIARHRHHMTVFQQERHLIEHDPQWRTVRRRRKDFELILDSLLGECEREGALSFPDRALTLRALLGMVNHTSTWLRPRGRLTPEQIADGYCDMLLGAYATRSTPNGGRGSARRSGRTPRP